MKKFLEVVLSFYLLWGCCYCDIGNNHLDASHRILRTQDSAPSRNEPVPTVMIENQQILDKNDYILDSHDIPIQKFSDTLRKVRRKESHVNYHDPTTVSKSIEHDVESSSTSFYSELELNSEESNNSQEAKEVFSSEILIGEADFSQKDTQVIDTNKPTHDDLSHKTVPVTEDVHAKPGLASPHLVSKTEDSVTEHSATIVQDATEGAQHPHSDAMPSFDEWKKMMLAEQEKGGHKLPSPGPPGKKISSQKRRRNYASCECGAKMVASNSEAEGTSRILNELVDEYMLNPCKAKIWFIIELCESVQASQIELANFELFSSSPKDFAVQASDNFPTRDWRPLGTFTAAEQRGLQSFQLNQEGYGKFIKIEFQSHYGKEHYCPLSVVRIFGTSMVDEYEEMETLSNQQSPQDDELVDLQVEDKGSSNIFGSATDVVYNIVKKAAQALGQHPTTEGETEQNKSKAEECKFQKEVCITKENGSSTSVPLDLIVSESTIQKTLFHHLRKCDQCVLSSRPTYYSITQPHCRFFQAALGPVLFQTICDYYKDHQLVSLQKAPVVDVENTTKTLSPPPKVISVIVDRKPIVSDSMVVMDIPVSPVFQDIPVISQESHRKHEESIHLQQPELRIEPTKTISNYDEISLDLVVDPSERVPSVATDVPLHTNSRKLSVVDSTLSDISSEGVKENVIYLPAATKTSVESPASIASAFETQLEQDVDDNGTTVIIETATVDNNLLVTEAGIDDFTEEMKPEEEKNGDSKMGSMKLDHVSLGGQKESVFVRMNNRIKALELNMSLSSQYLQELSQRYRRQMEEMQRAFNRTIGALNETARKADERDLKQQEVIGSLQAQVNNLTNAVDQLLSERTSVLRQMLETHVFLMVVEAIVMITIMSLCVRRISCTMPQQNPVNREVESPVAPLHRKIKRRNSADLSSPTHLTKAKKRCSSEEAITAADKLLIIEPIVMGPPIVTKVKKKKRKKAIPRSVSNPNMSPRNSCSSPSKTTKEDSSAAGIIFIHSRSSCNENFKNNPAHVCENCNKDVANSAFNYTNDLSVKENRTDSVPFQNLTNGNVEHLSGHKMKEKFSFKKFLRLQKRESI